MDPARGAEGRCRDVVGGEHSANTHVVRVRLEKLALLPSLCVMLEIGYFSNVILRTLISFEFV